MITNAVCTVVRAEDDIYKIIGNYPCMWQETEGYEVKKYGAENADKAAVWIPDITADVKKSDFIVRRKIMDISEFDPERALTVMSATRNNYGSDEMNHIEIGAR